MNYLQYDSLISKRKFNYENDWMKNPYDPLYGFTSVPQNHSVRLTMWSDAFLVDFQNEQIAIFLFESQGLYNEDTELFDTEDNIKILAIGSLISSVQIYNTITKLQSSNFKDLQTASNLAQIIQNKPIDPTLTPLQNLIALMRDWKKEKFSYGQEEGQNYLNNLFGIEKEKVQNYFNQTFDDVSCFLMPFPWKATNYREKIDPEFIENVKFFVESLLLEENIVKKSVSGAELTGMQYYEFIKLQLETFKSYEKTEPSEIMKQIFNGHKMSSLKIYEEARSQFREKGLKMRASHEAAKEVALTFLKAFDTKFESDFFEEILKTLEQMIENSYATYKNANETKILILIGILASILIVLVIFGFFVAFIMKVHRNNKIQHQYLSPTDVDDDKWLIERDRIDQLYSIGKGNYGEVFKGILHSRQKDKDSSNEIVAIKTIKIDRNETMTDQEFIELKADSEIKFVNEARRMTKFDSFHIMKLKGYWLRDKPYLMVMEYAEHGDLRTYLLKNRENYSTLHVEHTAESSNYKNIRQNINLAQRDRPQLPPLNHMMLEVADGMAYLESIGFVHRDLAARNCLVTYDLTVKIGDFGMSRFTDTSNYYMLMSSNDVPYRWLAPESLKNGKFSSKSDVFSFGVVMWEIVTMGETPHGVIFFVLLEILCKILNFRRTLSSLLTLKTLLCLVES